MSCSHAIVWALLGPGQARREKWACFMVQVLDVCLGPPAELTDIDQPRPGPSNKKIYVCGLAAACCPQAEPTYCYFQW